MTDWTASMRYDLRVIRAVAIKDIRSSLTERVFTVISIILPINFLLLFLLFVLTGGQAPTAVVLNEQGAYAQAFVSALENTRSFIIHQASAEEAANLMRQGRIVAIITVPTDFDARLTASQPVQLPVTVNNLDVDFTNDIRRAVPLAITSFYAQAYPDQVVVQAQEQDLQAHDTGYIQYLGVSLVVVSLMVGGLLQAGSNVAREYETGTIKVLLLAPASRWSVEVGKVVGALALNVLSAGVVLAVVVLVLGIHPVHWLATLGFTFLLMIAFVSLGTLAGMLVRRQTAVIPLSLGLALPLFFISGPFGPVQWGDAVTATLARLQPLSYAIALFQYSFHDFRTSSTSLSVDGLIVLAFALLAVGVSALVLRRQAVAH